MCPVKNKKIGAPKGNCNSVLHGAYMRLDHRRLDGRSSLAKNLNLLRKELTEDLGESPSRAQQLIVERVIFKAARLRFFEEALLRGETDGQANIQYIALSNSMRLDLMSLGMKRVEKKCLDLQGYIKKKESNDV